MLCAWIGHVSEKLWPFEYLESFRCSIRALEFLENIRRSISSVSICYAPESDMRINSYDDLNLSRAFVVQFLASWYNMSRNWTSDRKLMTIWISTELPLFNFDCLHLVCAWIGHASENLWPFEFLESFCCSISSVSICYAPESDMRVKSYDHFNFSRTSAVQL